MTEKAKPDTPIVFISSTVEDLEPFRKRARDAALAAGFHPRMMEYFPASGNPPLDECLARVSGSKGDCPVNLLIAIVAHRYGWVPEGQSDGEHKSITWLECMEAQSNNLEVLAFLVDKKADWPEIQRERHQMAVALEQGTATPELLQSVQKNVSALGEFKSWLSDGRVRATFTSPDNLQTKILIALQDWLKRHPQFQVEAQGDPTFYLRTLREETAYIDIRGLQGSGKATRFPVEEIYISLKTLVPQDPTSGMDVHRITSERAERLKLEEALGNPRLVVTGDPGAGKTTFLRRVCQLACRVILDDDLKAAQALGLSEATFPIIIRLSELQEHRSANKGRPGAPAVAAAPEWLVHFLASEWAEEAGKLDTRFFRKQLSEGPALLLLDGLDEASTEKDRASLVEWIEKVAARWHNCRIVVTSRPAAYKGKSVLAGFVHASIEALEDSAIETFLGRWCQALFSSDPSRVEEHHKELLNALRVRPDIRRMARNPVMLTALAVVHWNEKRLPEQRADLYESILTWLARSREDRPGRSSPERCLILLQALALAMQEHKEGRQVHVSRRWAAEAIAPLWRDGSDGERIAAAQNFLDEEEQDSGIVVRRGSELRFWHLTFQEYLAARALAGMGDQEQHQRILKRLYDSEWREVVLLLAGVLLAQGVDKVDNLISAALKRLGSKPTLRELARCAGILGAIVRDLAPLNYEPSDSRYHEVLEEVMGIFNKERSTTVPIEVVIEAAEALGQAGDPRFEGDQLEENWVEIPAGEFCMGARNKQGKNFDEEAPQWEGPVHRVHLDAYRIGRYPVTVAEYQRFVQDGGYEKKAHWSAGGFGEWAEPDGWEDQKQHPNRPVVGVSWFEAKAYAQWAGAKLPTEAQWERAARGTGGRKYPWGNKPELNPRLLNFDKSKTRGPTPVGVYPQGNTEEGIADLAGNVWEWCQDWFGDYTKQLQKNPTGSSKGERRVLRGGAWFYDAWNCRSSFRYWSVPIGRYEGIGFRVVLVSSSARTKKRKP